jgi:hypothetical protein
MILPIVSIFSWLTLSSFEILGLVPTQLTDAENKNRLKLAITIFFIKKPSIFKATVCSGLY